MSTTVAIEGGVLSRLPARAAEPFPKRLIRDLAAELRGVRTAAPVHRDQVIAHDVLGTGIDVIATRHMPRYD